MANDWTFDDPAFQKELLTWEQEWTRQKTKFPTTPSGDAVAIAKKLLKTFGEDAMNPTLGLGEILTQVTEKNFVGRWVYPANGKQFTRDFRADGTVNLHIDNSTTSIWSGFTWQLKGHKIKIYNAGGKVIGEHLLRDKDTLIFVGESWGPTVRKK